MDLQSYVRAIRKGWWIVLIMAALGGATGAAYNAQATPLYASKVTFFVGTPPDENRSALSADQFAVRRITTYVGMINSDIVAKMVIDTEALDLSVSQVKSKIVGDADLNTVLLTATVTDTSAERSLQIAKALAAGFNDVVASVDQEPVEIKVISGPSVNTNPVSPQKAFNLAVAIAAGFVIGIIITLLRQLLDTTVRSPAVLRALTDVPVLGVIPYDRAAKKAPLIVDRRNQSIRAESLRQLRTNLQFVDVEKPVRVLVVTSSIANEGKSSTATNLAISFADSGKKVLLVEGDLRRPRVADYLGLERAVGLTNVLVGQVEIEDVLQPWGNAGLEILSSGSIPPNPSELLGSTAMVELLEKLKLTFDIIVIDTPPLLPVTDGAVAAVQADGAVLVVRHGKTTRNQIATAQRSLASVDAQLFGCILNMSPARGADAYESHGYGYYEDDPKKHPDVSIDELDSPDSSLDSGPVHVT